MMLIIPERLAATCHATPERRAWFEQLPDAICELQEWWSLSLSAPFDGDEVSCACYVEPPCGPTVNPKYTVHIDL